MCSPLERRTSSVFDYSWRCWCIGWAGAHTPKMPPLLDNTVDSGKPNLLKGPLKPISCSLCSDDKGVYPLCSISSTGAKATNASMSPFSFHFRASTNLPLATVKPQTNALSPKQAKLTSFWHYQDSGISTLTTSPACCHVRVPGTDCPLDQIPKNFENQLVGIFHISGIALLAPFYTFTSSWRTEGKRPPFAITTRPRLETPIRTITKKVVIFIPSFRALLVISRWISEFSYLLVP